MGNKPRISIALIMAAVSFLAIDIAICQALWHTSGPPIAIAVVTLPMVNILFLTLPRLRSRPFWIGFHILGWSAAIASAAACWLLEDPFLRPVDIFSNAIHLQGDDWGVAAIIAFVVVFYTTPQLVVAILGGRLSARYRFVVERR